MLLAAGESSRLGQPKQLISFKGKSLLQHTVDVAMQTTCNPKVLVLGSSAADMRKSVNTNQFTVCLNERWKDGMSSSIQAGLEQALKSNPGIDGVLFLVSDQPFVHDGLLRKILDTFNGKDQIVACSYKDAVGVPALIGSDYFDELMNLNGDRGAKVLMNKYQNKVKLVSFEKGWMDIDTQKQYQELLNMSVNDGSND